MIKLLDFLSATQQLHELCMLQEYMHACQTESGTCFLDSNKGISSGGTLTTLLAAHFGVVAFKQRCK